MTDTCSGERRDFRRERGMGLMARSGYTCDAVSGDRGDRRRELLAKGDTVRPESACPLLVLQGPVANQMLAVLSMFLADETSRLIRELECSCHCVPFPITAAMIHSWLSSQSSVYLSDSPSWLYTCSDVQTVR